MSSHAPTYIPAPNWDIPADGDTVVLGQLIKDPKNPESKIPKSRVAAIPPSAVHEAEKTDWQTTLEQVRSGRLGLWAKCLQVVQGGLSLGQVKSSVESHRFAALETRYFVPDDEYLARVLEDPGAQAYLEVHNWRKPLFLITGVKVARGASVSTESGSERSARAELKVDASGAGVPVEVGPEAGWESERKRGVSYGGSTDYVFAYQLTRMKPKRAGGGSKNRSFVKGAVYGIGDEDGVGGPGVRDLFEVEEEADLGFPDSLELVDENDA